MTSEEAEAVAADGAVPAPPAAPAKPREAFLYDAFISYTHSTDADVVDDFQRQLELYGRPWYSPRAAVRIFRDRTGLPSGAKFAQRLHEAMAASSWLVLIASPYAAISEWVDKEVRWWLDMGRQDQLLIVLTGGEIVWDADTGRFDPEQTTALPPAVRDADFGEAPLWEDIRSAAGGTPAIRSAVLHEAATRINPNLLGVRPEALARVYRRRRNRALIGLSIAAAVFAAAAVTAVVFWLIAGEARDRADEQAAIATAQVLDDDADEEPDPFRATQLALGAYTLAPRPDTTNALLDSVLASRFVARVPPEIGEPPPAAIAMAGDRVVREGARHTLSLWDMADPSRPLRGPTSLDSPHTGRILAIAVTPDGRTAATGGVDGIIGLWDLATGGAPQLLTTLRRSTVNQGVVTTPNVGARENSDVVLSLAFSTDGRRLVAGGTGAAVTLYDVSRREAPGSGRRIDLPLTGLEVLGVALAPDGRTLAVGSRTVLPGGGLSEASVRLYDVTDVSRPTEVSAPLIAGVQGVDPVPVAFGPDGRTVLTGQGRAPRVWRLGDGPPRALRTDDSGPHNTAVNALAASPDGITLATGGFDDRVILWKIEGDRVVRAAQPLVGQGDDVAGVAFTSDTNEVVAAGADGAMIVWQARDGLRPRVADEQRVGQGALQSLATSSDGGYLLTGGIAKDVVLWDVTGPAPRPLDRVPVGSQGTPPPDLNQRGAVAAFAPTRRTIATASSDGTVRLLDIGPEGRLRQRGATLKGPTAISAIVFAPDGKSLVLGDDAGWLTHVVDVDTPGGPRLSSVHPAATTPIADLEFSRDGSTFVAAIGTLPDVPGSVAQLWTLASGRPTRLGPDLVGHAAGLTAASFVGPGGSTVLTGSRDGTLRRWDVTDPSNPRSSPGPSAHVEGVSALSVSRDGRTAVTGGADQLMRLWDLTDPAEVRPLGPAVRASGSQVLGLGMAPDGPWMWMATREDDTLRVIDLSGVETARHNPAAVACRLRDVAMTPEQWGAATDGEEFRASCPPPDGTSPPPG
ncbi:toll/interleukin-1 receptor domain-containing protein [Actinomycetospora aeridis]|uniref:TIR domain-containing protein n=1 Tax=Actinomycetospora aeridis TaxID=3129231 RepID=A0ABU8N701_9PSEU